MSEPEGEPGGLAEGTLISHLLELRDRLLKAMLAVGICFVPCAIYMNQLFTFVAEPLKRKLPPGATLIATSVGLCLAATQAPQGSVIVSNTQSAAEGQ